MSTISIELPKTDFRGGDTITGTVVVVATRRIRSRGVRLLCEGYESEGWATGLGEAGIPKKNFLFKDELELSGDGSVDSGTHRYAFEYELPAKLPGDYESHRGEAAIRYQLTAYVDRPMWVDMRTTLGLTMYEPHDEAAKSARGEGQKTCQFRSDAHIDIKAGVDKNILAPGETAHVSVSVDNQYDKEVRAIKVGIESTESMNIDGEEHQHADMVHETVFEKSVEPGGSRDHEIDYTLGPDIYASIAASGLIRVSHNLVITLDVPAATDAYVRIPIVVREIPGSPTKGHGV